MFSRREQAFEAEYAGRQMLEFQAHARRNKLFGLWAARRQGMSDEAAARYAETVMLEDFPHFRANLVLQRVAADFVAAKIAVPEHEITWALANSADRALAEGWSGRPLK